MKKFQGQHERWILRRICRFLFNWNIQRSSYRVMRNWIDKNVLSNLRVIFEYMYTIRNMRRFPYLYRVICKICVNDRNKSRCRIARDRRSAEGDRRYRLKSAFNVKLRHPHNFSSRLREQDNPPSDNWNLAGEIRFSTRLREGGGFDPSTRPFPPFFFLSFSNPPLAVYHFTEPRFGLHLEQ